MAQGLKKGAILNFESHEFIAAMTWISLYW